MKTRKKRKTRARHRRVKVWFYLVWFGFRVSWNYPRPGSIVLERERCAAAFDCSLDICVRSAEILICVVGQGMSYFPGQPVRFRFYSLSLPFPPPPFPPSNVCLLCVASREWRPRVYSTRSMIIATFGDCAQCRRIRRGHERDLDRFLSSIRTRESTRIRIVVILCNLCCKVIQRDRVGWQRKYRLLIAEPEVNMELFVCTFRWKSYLGVAIYSRVFLNCDFFPFSFSTLRISLGISYLWNNANNQSLFFFYRFD